MVGNFLGTQDQFVLVALQVAEHIGVAPARQGDRTAGCKAQFAGIDQVERRVLQYLGVHGQVFERRIDQAAHYRVGNGADTGLQRAELVGHAPGADFLLEEVDQVIGNRLGIHIRWQHGGR
ncbi:hypothetical protein D3C87_1875250 [compost metagenome]